MLHLIPNGLDATLLIPVLVGVVAMFLTTEWWGWDFVGVVVPGYLASLFLIQPVVAGVVLFEGLLAWALVRLLDGLSSRGGLTFPVFGRDRFYLVLVAAVLVRLGVEGFLLQWLVTQLGVFWPGAEGLRTELFGLGTVLVPLTANRLWRGGALSGLTQLGLHTGFTWLVLLALAHLTNFSIGSFDLAYDQLALAFFSSPRLQMAILLTAALASGLNRSYGWDFHGIVVPALLALATSTPVKLLGTAAEAGLIVLVARSLVQLPLFKGLNIEGTRKLLICFLIGFGLKLVGAVLLTRYSPMTRPSDYFGLGYLLPSLLAERVWIKSNVALVALPTLQVAVLGAALTAVLGAGLALSLGTVPAPAGKEAAHFGSLPQAVAVLAPPRRGGAPVAADDVLPWSRGAAVADTADGYRLFARPDVAGLLAVPSAQATVLRGTLSEGEPLAARAVRENAALLLSGPGAPLQLQGSVLEAGTATRDWLLTPGGGAATAPGVIVEGAARLALWHGQLASAERLSGTLAALRFQVLRAAHGGLLVGAPSGFRVFAREQPRAVVVAPHHRELDASAVAWWASAVLQADCVVGDDDGAEALSFSSALAQRLAVPLLIVRGTEQVSESAFVTRPRGSAEAWLQPLVDAAEGRVAVAFNPPELDPSLNQLPSRAGASAPTALWWLSLQARQVLAPSGRHFEANGVSALLTAAGVSRQTVDLAGWVSGGASAPGLPEEKLRLVEELARSRDWSRLPGRVPGLVALSDPERGLEALGLELSGARGAVVLGPRDERRAGGSREALDQALLSGARTLTPRGAP